MLLNLARAALESAGWPTAVQVRRQMFELGENERHTADHGAGTRATTDYSRPNLRGGKL